MRGVPWILCGLMIAASASAATMEEAARLFEEKKWPEAAAAYGEIAAREPGNSLALIRLARSRASNGDSTGTLEALKAWFATGSGSYQVAMTLPGIRDTPIRSALHCNDGTAEAM